MLNALKNLYVKLGGALTDTYEGIAGGKPVSDYIMKTDVVSACAEKAEGGGGGSSSVEAIEFEYTGEIGSTQTLTSVKTAAEIVALAEDGKALIGIAEIAEGTYMQGVIGTVAANSIQIYLPSGDNMISVIATAASLSDHYVATIGS